MLNEATRAFILAHAQADVHQLALRGSKDPDVDMGVALQQIQGRQTARRKLPSWAATDGIIYPPHLSLEQCSSESTARYKAAVVVGILPREGRQKLVDLTGGLGVDFTFMSDAFEQAVYVEQQQHLCDIAAANLATLGKAGHTTTVCTDGTGYLHRLDHASLIFLDPARRDNSGMRTYGIGDCTPNVLAILDELLQKADKVMLKLSPMLDWRKAMVDIGSSHVEQVHIVSADGECKELLLVLSAAGSDTPQLVCANDGMTMSFSLQTPPVAARYCDGYPSEGDFLYEPNASLMKAGLFGELSLRFNVRQIAPNSHLFISPTPIEQFPGRKFQISAISSMNKKELQRKIIPLRQANITVRNFPLTVAGLRRRLKLSEGGSNYLFATTLANGDKVLVVTQKI